ncbi:hypothetical protein NMG60_11037258 [Bertholletia excelsa]
MDEVNQTNIPSAPSDNPVKRKRGRPRKDQSLNHRGVAQVAPGFGGVNQNQSHQPSAVGNANDTMVGQEVRGVVEAAFDAGYLLTVRIGNSSTSLRGVVFKPGHYVPISSENDVAPHAKMIRRNEIPIPMGKQIRNRHRSKESKGMETGHKLNGSTPANRTADPLASKGKHVLPVSTCTVSPVGSRGTVVPVVLEPANFSNGLPPGKEMQTDASQVPSSLTQTSLQVEPVGMQNENSPFDNRKEVKTMKQDGASTLNEVNKGVGGSSQSSEQHNEGMTASKSSAKDSSPPPEGVDNTEEPLFVEPLRAVWTRPLPGHPEHNRIGRMSELLQAMQESMTDDKVPTVKEATSGN